MEPCYKEELRRCRPHLLAVSGVVAMWKCVVTVLCLTIVVRGAEVQQPSASVAKTLKVESDPWMSFIECFKSDAPGGCLQRRAFKALLSWAEGDEANEITSGGQRNTESDDEEPKVEGLPAGTPPAVGRIIDRLGDLIATSLAQFYPEPNDDGTPNLSAESEQRSNGVEQVRGHKKKVKKELKKLAIKILILLYVLQQTKKLILETLRTFAYVKISLIAAMYVAIQGIKLWHWLKQKHHMKEHSAVLYETGHAIPHHYAPEHHEVEYEHEEHHPVWGRRSVETSRVVPAPVPVDAYTTYYADPDAAHSLAYAAQIPSDRNYVKAR
ncbi:uncharacterized protein LOC111055870 isoform X2 [Nilaparvata lugens]|uniref:uncharacterized protein LOC111055870 isoform X2 n=1 Tax=Nilaparvata lugens TaxID=108931 RepID=UPI00193DD85C|nr:uncharacterized protein LOC111055870 isoform X2 [Nilaparvata lugens]